ncbi:MAG TPA: transglutaminaseTgpA domain-containing protein [Nocardiopsis listeri]|uniref:transglutaminaseTgpA domain-containing protein n=1 Tax=Nocardiopsis listeri TaxID=53440 RepID=UPI001D942DCE|nr:transglutaminaseTgpA domain-containing protein [Nocardiopsis listeri]HJE59191.1 transglutaminaseTgpA domain-containing protein [Nocardiopsis listeri]
MPLATLVTMLASLPLLSGLVRGDAWWVPAAVLMTVVALVSTAYRSLVGGAFAVPFLQLFAVLLLYAPLFAPETTALGFLPTLDTLDHTGALFVQGLHTIDTNTPPVSPTPGLNVIIALVFMVFTMTADFLAVTARCPGMVGGLLLSLLVVPLFVDDAGMTWGPAAITAIGFLALLAVDMWVRSREWGTRVRARRGPGTAPDGVAGRVALAALVSVVAVSLALLLPQVLPSLRTDALYTLAEGGVVANDSVTTTHPMVSLRRDLGSNSDRTVLTYRTEDEEPEYLRTFVLDEFDGENWTMTPVHAGRDSGIDGTLPTPPGRLTEPDEDELVTTRISLDSDTPPMDFLPLPYPARSVEIAGDWYVDESTLMVFTTETPPSGYNFVVTSSENRPGARELDAAGPPRSLTDDRLHLPEGLDERVQELTGALVEGADSDYESALALQEFFTDGEFTYDLTPPPVPEGTDPLTHFLFEDRIGYCEQYAGAMAVMARQAGIPARVAVGYTAGRPSGEDRWTVAASDAHAWPELYFEGAGWVRFEPTPADPDGGQGTASRPDYSTGVDELPDNIAPEPNTDDEPEADESPEEDPSPTPEASGSPDEESDGAADGLDETGSVSGGQGPPGWLPGLLVGLVALLSAALPALVRALVRRARRSAVAAGGTAAAHTAWRELRDTCSDLGVTWDLTESPRSTAARLATVGEKGIGEEAGGALWRLALAEEGARYAPEPRPAQGLQGDLDTVVAALTGSVTTGRRWRAVLLPRSLAPWSRPRIEADPLPGLL